MEHPPINGGTLSIKFNNNDVVCRIENEINTDIEIESKTPCLNEEIKNCLKVGIPLSIAVTLWTYGWLKFFEYLMHRIDR